MKSALGLAVLVLVGCGEKNKFAGRERLEAPRGKQDVGTLLDAAKEADVQKILDQYPDARVRVLSKNHGLYEIFGASLQQIQDTGVRAQSNEYIELVSRAVPEGMTVPGWPACRAGRPGPTVALNVTSPSANINGTSITWGTKISMNTSGSTPNAKSSFIVLPPAGSLAGNHVVPQSKLELTPDALGVYQVIALVQDADGACAMDGATFVVTANKAYNGPSQRNINVSLSQFKHLAMVDAVASWDLSQGEGLTIAVIDSGVNYNHPSLAANIALNGKEIPGNGLDDDGNGYVDDVLGYDFVNSDEFPYDDDGHGSHVAGLAASKHFGLAKRAKILSVKALNGLGGDVGSIAAALRYSVDRGAKIVNMSLGGPQPLPHPAIVSAMDYADRKGVLVVVSAGNGDPQTGLGFSIDEIPFYPANLTNENVVTVASFDANNAMSTYSNFGKKNVDVVAPGGAMPNDPMFSCTTENPRNALFAGMSGTSMAAPVVSGIAAQVWSMQPGLSVAQLKEILMTSGEQVAELAPVVGSGRKINSLSALDKANARNVLF